MTRRSLLLRLGVASWAGGTAVGAARPTLSCATHLRAIAEALSVYRQMHDGLLPPRLKQLSQLGLIDPSLLYCPDSSRHPAHSTEQALATQAYEWFLQIPEDKEPDQQEARREHLARHLRKQAMGLGEWLPVVRCGRHLSSKGEFLNACLNGTVFRSTEDWEYRLTHVVPYPYLRAPALIDAQPFKPLKSRIPPRSPLASERQIDLGSLYNGAPSDPWTEGYPGDEAPELLALGDAAHLLPSRGVLFDLRGVVQLEGTTAVRVHADLEKRNSVEARFSRVAAPLSLNVVAETVHLLCGVILEEPAGTVGARIELDDEHGETHRYDLRHGDHFAHGTELTPSARGSMVWRRPPENRTIYAPRSVSHVTWRLGSRRRLRALRFEATQSASSPFLIAVTVE